MNGIQFLEAGMDLFPLARRVLLTAYADTDAAIDAINLVDVDHYLLKPWHPPEEKLYPVLDGLIDAWRATPALPMTEIRVVGHRWSAPSFKVRDFLARNMVPYRWYLAEDPEGGRLLAAAGVAESQVPLLVTPEGKYLVKPSEAEIAAAVGLTSTPAADFYDLAVVGGGPGGLGAAVYGASEGLRTVLVERRATGGQAGQSSRIENYLGFPDGVSGAQLTDRARRQAQKFGAELLTPRRVSGLRLRGSTRVLSCDDGAEIAAHTVILATGVSYRLLDVPGLAELTGRGVFYGSAATEAPSCSDQDVYVVGGANSAGQSAVYFARFARRVHLLVRAEGLERTMSRYLIEQISAIDNVEVHGRRGRDGGHAGSPLPGVTMTENNDTAERLAPEQLKKLFLFQALDDDQLRWLSEHGRVETRAAGTPVCVEGEPATCFYVLIEGPLSTTRRVRGAEVEVSRTDQKGVYGGAFQAYLGDAVEQVYLNTLMALTPVKLWVLPANEFATLVRTWFPMAMHLLEGLFVGMRASQTVVGERERLLALGSLSAGLTHELNNPASAAVRATATLRDRVAGMRHKLAMIADGRLDGRQLHRLVELQEAAVKRAAAAPRLTALEASDAEDLLAQWLEERELTAPWDLAATLVAGNVTVDWLDEITEAVGEADLESAVRWLAYTIETELLMGEIDDSVTRISGLVAAAKQYSQLDRAPHQVVDVHDLLDSTLLMLTAKTPPGVRVVKEFDRSLPTVPAYPAELNQVWTNLIDNALSAMAGEGTLTVRTERDGTYLAVSIHDTGPGIPPEIRPRIFEPFFTTKPVGEGTGLGLDISYRIVVKKHHGDIRVRSAPGDTTFWVLLPVTDQA